MSYIIAMNFISWMVAIWMLIGYLVVKSCESDLMQDNPQMESWMKRVAYKIVLDYDSRNFAGRVAMILFLGARMMAMPFKIKRRD